MRSILLIAAICVASAGCCSTPSAIVDEIHFMDTVVRVGVKETEGFESANAEDAQALGLKAVNALRRLAPHTDNLKRWSDGEEPAGDSE